jgi:hypothetical protein
LSTARCFDERSQRWRLHQEGGAVLLGGDREVLGEGEDPHAGGLELDAGGRPGVLLDRADHLDGRLLGAPLHLLPGLLGDLLAAHHRLHGAGAVAHLEEADLAAGALVLQPAQEADLPVDVVGEVSDGDGGRGAFGIGHGRSVGSVERNAEA